MLKIGSFGAHPALSLNSLGGTASSRGHMGGSARSGCSREGVPPEGNQVSLGLSPGPALLFLRGSQVWNEPEDTPVVLVL